MFEFKTPHRTVAVCECCGRLEDASLLLSNRRQEEATHRETYHPTEPGPFRMLASVLGTIQDRRIR